MLSKVQAPDEDGDHEELTKIYASQHGEVDYNRFMKDMADAVRPKTIPNEITAGKGNTVPIVEEIRREQQSNIFDDTLLPNERMSISGFRKKRKAFHNEQNTTRRFLDEEEDSPPGYTEREMQRKYLNNQRDEHELRQLKGLIQERLLLKSKDFASAYRQFDKNERGVVTLSDFRKRLENIGLKLTDHQFELLQRSVKKDDRGVIDFMDFARHLHPQDYKRNDGQLARSITRDQIGNPIYDYYKALGLFRKGDTLGRGAQTFESDIFGLTDNEQVSPKRGRRCHYEHAHSSRSNILVGAKHDAETEKLRKIAQHVSEKEEDITRKLKRSDNVTLEELERTIKECGVPLTDAELKEITSAIFARQNNNTELPQMNAQDAVLALGSLKDIEANIDDQTKDDTEKPTGKRFMKRYSSETDLLFSGAQRARSPALNREERPIFRKMADKIFTKNLTARDFFRHFAVNQNGLVSQSGFKEGMKALGFSDLNNEINKVYQCLDRKGDGSIKFDEFTSVMDLDSLKRPSTTEAIHDKKKNPILMTEIQEMEVPKRKGIKQEFDKRQNQEALNRRERELRARLIQKVRNALAQSSRSKPVGKLVQKLDDENRISSDEFRSILQQIGVHVNTTDFQRLMNGAKGLSYRDFKSIFATDQRSKLSQSERFGPNDHHSSLESLDPEDDIVNNDVPQDLEQDEMCDSVQVSCQKSEQEPENTQSQETLQPNSHNVQKQESCDELGTSRNERTIQTSYDERPSVSENRKYRREHIVINSDSETRQEHEELLLRQKISDKLHSRFLRMGSVFHKLDVDRDGKVSFGELKRGLSKLGLHFNSRQYGVILRDIGTDGHGYIRVQNFVEYTNRESPLDISGNRKYDTQSSSGDLQRHRFVEGDPLFEKLNRKMSQRSADVRDVFRLFDENKDGEITSAEFKRGIDKIGLRLSEDEVERVMQICNVSKSGVLNYQEFASVFRPINNLLPKAEKTVEQRKEEYVNRCMRNELIEAAQGAKGKIHETFRVLDRSASRVIPAEVFRRALYSLDKHVPKWVVERAVRMAQDGHQNMCNYDKFLQQIDLATAVTPRNSIDQRSTNVITLDSDTSEMMAHKSEHVNDSSHVTRNISPRRGIYRPVSSGDIIGHTTPIRERPDVRLKYYSVNAKKDSGDIIGHNDAIQSDSSPPLSRGVKSQSSGHIETTSVVERLHLSPGRRFQFRPTHLRNPIIPETFPDPSSSKQKKRGIVMDEHFSLFREESHQMSPRRSEFFHRQFNSSTNDIFSGTSSTPENPVPRRINLSRDSGDIIFHRDRHDVKSKASRSSSTSATRERQRPRQDKQQTILPLPQSERAPYRRILTKEKQIPTSSVKARSPSPPSVRTIEEQQAQKLRAKVQTNIMSKFSSSRDAFRSFDKHKTGLLTVDDIKHKLQESNIDLSKYELRQVFRKDPSLKDNLVSFKDFNDTINPQSDSQKMDTELPRQRAPRKRRLPAIAHRVSDERSQSAPPISPSKPRDQSSERRSATPTATPRTRTSFSCSLISQPVRSTRFGSPFNPLRHNQPLAFLG